MVMKYDVIIAGASFAGLAVAKQLKGNILLIDKDDVGEGQTSACATPISLIEKCNAQDSIQEIHNVFSVYVGNKLIDLDLEEPFVAFDYRKFCKSMFKDLRVEFKKTIIRSVNCKSVSTDDGDFEADYIVDCRGYKGNSRNSIFGLETEIEYKTQNLQFYLTSSFVKNGYGWAFPCGDRTRFGVAKIGTEGTKDLLEKFLAKFGLVPSKIHGGFIPSQLQIPVRDNIFFVGDSAGQCVPFSLEGIRPAIYFGTICGKLINRMMKKEITYETAVEIYSKHVNAERYLFLILGRVQYYSHKFPKMFYLFSKLFLRKDSFWYRSQYRYLRHFNIENID
ncbi:MAG: hypothetical protein NT099_05630 [Candidatus Saganbacteria bacterium]|nr:hypothetical protein [Candidatus Saganbacteria bacterium]